MKIYLKLFLYSVALVSFMEACLIASVEAAGESEKIGSSAFDDLATEQERVDFQIKRYDILYAKNTINSLEDFQNKRIPDYIQIVRDGINYVRNHYINKDENKAKFLQKNERDSLQVIQKCDALERDITAFLATEAGQKGMTPLEFVFFNFKLADAQEYSSSAGDEEYKYWLGKKNFKNATLGEMRRIFAIKPLNEDSIKFMKPYIIYTPNGRLSIHLIMSHIFKDEPVSLQVLFIGELSREQGPHWDKYLTPEHFLIHDFQHSEQVFGHRNYIERFKVLQQKGLNLNDPIIEYIAFEMIHENNGSFYQYLLFPDGRSPNASERYGTTVAQNIMSSDTTPRYPPAAYLDNRRASSMMMDALFADFFTVSKISEERKSQKIAFIESLQNEFAETYKTPHNVSHYAFRWFLTIKVLDIAHKKIEAIQKTEAITSSEG